MKNRVLRAVRHMVLTAVVMTASTHAEAQLQYIPETWMRDWLNGLATGCVDSTGYLNPNDPGLAVVETADLIPGTLDLTGIQYLHHLKDLSIQCNGAGVFTPVLPDSLERLTVEGYGFTGALTLPPSLRYFNAGSTYTWTGVLAGNFPATLDTLIYNDGDQNTDPDLQLASLPEGLLDLELHVPGRIVGLDHFPTTLRTLRLHTDSTLCLPVLPGEMDLLELGYSSVFCIPDLPYIADAANLLLEDPGLRLCDAFDACLYGPGALRGSVWHDLDNDGVHDPGEIPMAGDAVLIDAWGLAGTLSDGRWAMPVDTGTYSIVPVPASPYVLSASPAQTIASITTGAPIDSLNDFLYQLLPGITDVSLDMTSFQAHAGYFCQLDLVVRNLGTEIATGALSLQLDTNVQFESANYQATFSGNTVEWSWNDLALGEIRHFLVSLQIPFDIPLGTVLVHSATVITTAPDLDLSNNSMVTNVPVQSSWDPNDKQVRPSNGTPEEVANGAELTYTIRFQNTGNYPASRIVISDTLSTLSIPTSFRFLSSSHPCSWVLSHGILAFRFDPIQLPDSASDPEGSMGYVKFSLRTTSGLVLGDEVTNVANIFFDLNAPVITAPAVFTVTDQATAITMVDKPNMALWPNPAGESTYVSLSGTWSPSVQVSIVDVLGRRTAQVIPGNGVQTIDLSQQAPGVICLDLFDGIHRRTALVVKR